MHFHKPTDFKKVTALAASIIGIIVLGTGFYYKNRLGAARKGIETLASPLGNNPFSSVISSSAKESLKSYEIKIHLFIGVGAVLTALGISYFVYLRQRKH